MRKGSVYVREQALDGDVIRREFAKLLKIRLGCREVPVVTGSQGISHQLDLGLGLALLLRREVGGKRHREQRGGG